MVSQQLRQENSSKAPESESSDAETALASEDGVTSFPGEKTLAGIEAFREQLSQMQEHLTDARPKVEEPPTEASVSLAEAD